MTLKLSDLGAILTPGNAAKAGYGAASAPGVDISSPESLICATLAAKGVAARVVETVHGPQVTAYRLELTGKGTVRQVQARALDLQIALGCLAQVRVDCGLWVDVQGQRKVVGWDAGNIRRSNCPLEFFVGQLQDGCPLLDNLALLPHLLIAGETGSGKSVALQGLLCDLLRFGPQEVKLALIDCKRVELAAYADLPHLLLPLAEDVPAALRCLDGVLAEVDKRYGKLAAGGYRSADEGRRAGLKLPPLVLVIDELADLMGAGGEEISAKLVRVAQLSRAAGVHIVAATQRPTSAVISGDLKANLPAVLALSVRSATDARVVGVLGAEKLLGCGDALFVRPGSAAVRVQVPLASEADITAAIGRWPAKPKPPEPKYTPAPCVPATLPNGQPLPTWPSANPILFEQMRPVDQVKELLKDHARKAKHEHTLRMQELPPPVGYGKPAPLPWLEDFPRSWWFWIVAPLALWLLGTLFCILTANPGHVPWSNP